MIMRQRYSYMTYSGCGFKRSTSGGVMSRPRWRRSSMKNSLKPACTNAGVLSHFKIRGLGSATLHLAYVAAGILDGCVDYNVKIWDLAAAIPLVRAAGGEVHFLNGEQLPMRLFDLKMKQIVYVGGGAAICKRLRELMAA